MKHALLRNCTNLHEITIYHTKKIKRIPHNFSAHGHKTFTYWFTFSATKFRRRAIFGNGPLFFRIISWHINNSKYFDIARTSINWIQQKEELDKFCQQQITDYDFYCNYISKLFSCIRTLTLATFPTQKYIVKLLFSG